MKKLLNKGKALVAIVSIFAILAVSVLSMFTGVNLTTFASSGTVSTFTASVPELSLLDSSAENSKDNPYIIGNAGQLYALVTGKATHNGTLINTAGKYFKVADGIDAFYMNGGETVAALSSASDVKSHFESNGSSYTKLDADKANPFQGTFDGNGAVVYGLYADNGTTWGRGAALFSYASGNVTIKNVAVRNSYFKGFVAAGIVGNARTTVANVQLTIETCEISNNYLESTGADAGSGGLVGYMWSEAGTVRNMPLTVNNCLVYGNSLTSTQGKECSAIGGNFNGTNSINNSVLLGYRPFLSGYATYRADIWNGCYTDQTVAGVNDQNYAGRITKVESSDIKGAAAKEAMSTLDESVWFFSENSIPKLRAFHTIKATSVGINGHQNEKDACCGNNALISQGVFEHTYVNNKCPACDFVYPCAAGHTFTAHQAVEPTVDRAGNIAYNSCSGCLKNYAIDADVNAPASSALQDVTLPQLASSYQWNGKLDKYFWMNNSGDGSAAKPFIIGNAEQLAALVSGMLEYNADQPTANNFDLSKYTLNGSVLVTAGLYFKVRDGIETFYMNGGNTVAALSSASAVKSYFENSQNVKSTITGDVNNPFQGNFNGNGAVVYGLYVENNHWLNGAGLFPKVAGTATIKNIAVRNSYLKGQVAGGIVGSARSYNKFTNVQLTIEGCESSNNCIISTGGDAGSGGLVGFMGYTEQGNIIMPLTVNNCLVYGNELSSTANKSCTAVGGQFAGTNSINNSIFLGYMPFNTSYATYRADRWNNCYTDQTVSGVNDQNYTNKITTVTAENLTGAPSLEVMGTLDKTVWLFNTKTHPQLRAFHTLSGEAVDENVHKNEKDVCCNADVIGVDTVAHAYTGASCGICGYTFECAKVGHNFTVHKGFEATYDNDGEIPHKSCSVCFKNYPYDAADNAPVTEAIESVIIPQIIHFDSGKPWTGRIATQFREGEGTPAKPYIIDAPEYLALMLNMDATDLYFELTTDIIINDTSAADWKDTAKWWFTSEKVSAFNGTLKGNGKTVSGLYYGDVEADVSAGLIPVKGSGNVTNVVVANSYINGKSGASVGALIGSVAYYAPKPINMWGNTVQSTVVIEGGANAGGLVGTAGYSALRISNCNSQATINATGTVGGIVGVASVGTSVKNSISIGTAPVGDVGEAAVANVYTNANTSVKGVTVLTDEQIKGDAAATNMTALDFVNAWKTTTNDYPAINGVIKFGNGAKGDAWSGEAADGLQGSGTPEDPFLIGTGEELAYALNKHQDGKHYKLVADIYLNDVNSPLWADKIGCTEWLIERSYNGELASKFSLFKYGTFDGDGYVVYGLYYNRGDQQSKDYDYAGLFPLVSEGAVIKNVGISDAHIEAPLNKDNGMIMSTGALIGAIDDWDKDFNMAQYNEDAAGSKAVTSTPEYQARMPEISNCFVDHKSYVSGYRVGALVGWIRGSIKVNNCIVTATVEGGTYKTEITEASEKGNMVGQDESYGSYYSDCLSFPRNFERPLGGYSNADWRNNAGYYVSTIEDFYYFALNRTKNDAFKMVAKPTDRFGDGAKLSMSGLDWENTWRTVKDGTPILAIFDKHRDDADKFSDTQFDAPEVTVSFVTGTSEVVVEDMVGKMYTKMELPVIEREGYKFTGWYTHDNLSIKYPVDYFPPITRSLYAGWERLGIFCDFEDYTNTLWDYDDTRWTFNRPGAKGGYKNQYVRKGSKSMHLLDTSAESADVLLNYEDMLEVGKSYTMTFWVTTDKANNPDTKLSLVHNSKPVYLDTGIAVEDMVVVKGLTVGEWTQYKYTFTAQTKWVSIRATGNSSLYFDDIIMAPIDETVTNSNLLFLGTGTGAGAVTGDDIAPNTSDNAVSVAVLISAIMACAIVVVDSRKNLVEIIED